LAAPWLRLLVAGLSPRRSNFSPWSIHVGFVNKVALVQVFLRVLLFSPVNVITPRLSIVMYHLADEKQARWWEQFRDIVSPQYQVTFTFHILYNNVKYRLIPSQEWVTIIYK
jgi:hypothetical protein